MNTIEQLKADAKDLAVAYQALWHLLDMPEERRVAQDWNGIAVWAGVLKRVQASLDIELMPDASLDNHVAVARRERGKCDAIARGTLGEDDIPPHDQPIPQPSKRVRLIREKMGLWLVKNEDGSIRARLEKYNEATAYCAKLDLEVMSVIIADADMSNGTY